MILIQRIKKIKREVWFKEMLFDLIFYAIFFSVGAFFILGRSGDNKEKLLKIEQNEPQNTVVEESVDTDLNSGSQYVASSRGKYFYKIGSSRANSLSDKNKVYFSSQEEATKLGFKPYLEG